MPRSRTALIAIPDLTCIACLGSLCTLRAMKAVCELLISRCIIAAKNRNPHAANTAGAPGLEAGTYAARVGQHGESCSEHSHSIEVQSHMSMQASAAVFLQIFRLTALINCQRSGRGHAFQNLQDPWIHSNPFLTILPSAFSKLSEEINKNLHFGVQIPLV